MRSSHHESSNWLRTDALLNEPATYNTRLPDTSGDQINDTWVRRTRMADISLKGLLMDNGVAAQRWSVKLLQRYRALDQMMRVTAAECEAECGGNAYVALSYMKKTVAGVTIAGTQIRYRPTLAWRLRARGAELCGMASWVPVEPFYPRDISERTEKTAVLSEYLQRNMPATWERFKVYEVMKQRLRSEASLLYRVLCHLDELNETIQWIALEGNQPAVQEARERLIALRNRLGLKSASLEI